MDDLTKRRRARRRWYWLLALPFVATLWLPLYAHHEPSLGSMPFFYWYQFAWIVLTAVLTAIVYVATRE